MKNITCIIGLGNKGNEFINTRHNVGKDFLLWLARKENLEWKNYDLFSKSILNINNKEINLIIPNSYINESGIIIKKINSYFKDSENILIVNDDIQVEFNKFSFRFNNDRGERGHNGIRSINKNLKNKFENSPYYLSIGIGRPKNKEDIGNFVIEKFNISQLNSLESIFSQILLEMNIILK